MIRTLVEIQGGRVSIRETGAETTVTVTVDSASSGVAPSRDQVDGSWRDSLNRNQLLTEIDRLEKGLEYWKKQYSEREAARAKLEREMNEALTRARKAEAEVERQRERADQNKAWAMRAEATAAKDQDRVSKVRDAVYGPYIPSALKHPWTSWTEIQAVALANAVRNVRQAIVSPESETSQA